MEQQQIEPYCVEWAEIENKRLDEEKHHNDRIFNAIKKVKGISFYNNLCECIFNNCYVFGKFQIVKKPYGDKIDEAVGLIKNHWVDQSGPGITGDSYSGFIYVMLKRNKYLKVEYSC